MSVILRNIQIPLFIKIEPDCLQMLRKILDEHHLHFQRPMIISHAHILELGGNDALTHFLHPATTLVKTNSIAEATEIAKEIQDKGNDLVISIGGGRILDMGKYAATKARVNYISIPTSPSNDGICSPVAVLTNEDGVTESMPVNMPIGILVDTNLLTSAPLQNIKAGIGDLISNFSAIADWRLAYKEGQERMDDFAASMAYSAAQLVFETQIKGDTALQAPSFLEKLTHGLILSGIAMNITGNSRPCSGAEHKISHAMDLLYPKTSLHGLQVAFGTLFAGFLRGEDLTEYIHFFKQTGLPLHYSELGFTDEQFQQVLLRASSTRPERYTILEQKKVASQNAQSLIQQYNGLINTSR